MKAKTDEQHDVGVIVGRFQVPELHQAHEDLIESVITRHDKVIIFLGLSPVPVTRENPLDFEARKQMLLDRFPKVIVAYAKDMASDEVWSKKLDSQIGDLTTPAQKPVLYGGRDSFIAHYSGKFPTVELEPEVYVNFSGSEIRKQIASRSTKATPEFRAGASWAAWSRFPVCYPTVDVAILNDDENELLMAKKPHEDKWRFIGGFADPSSPSLEADARREVAEEAHIEITDPKYIGSCIIDDWRYRTEADKIKTTFFVAKFFSGSPKPDDDIEELGWLKLNDLFAGGRVGQSMGRSFKRYIMPSHCGLMELLYSHLVLTT